MWPLIRVLENNFFNIINSFRKRRIILPLLLLLKCLIGFFPIVAHAHTLPFLALSDIHFDPLLSCREATKPCPLALALQKNPVSAWKQIFLSFDHTSKTMEGVDTHYALLSAFLKEAKKIAQDENAKFVLVLGDSLSHHFKKSFRAYTKDYTEANYRHFVDKTFLFLNQELSQAFPQLAVYQIVGNNDSYHQDYVVALQDAFFSHMAVIWSQLIKEASLAASMLKEFPKGGYYTQDLSYQKNVAPLRLVFLNTVLFSNKAKGKQIDVAAQQELNWLYQTLSKAAREKKKVLLIMHIPPTLEVNLSDRIHLFTLLALWQTKYKMAFQQTLQTFAPIIVVMLAGHLHMENLSRTSLDEGHLPLLIVPAVSPIYGNHPGVGVYRYSLSSHHLTDYSIYYLLTATGKLYKKHARLPI